MQVRRKSVMLLVLVPLAIVSVIGVGFYIWLMSRSVTYAPPPLIAYDAQVASNDVSSEVQNSTAILYSYTSTRLGGDFYQLHVLIQKSADFVPVAIQQRAGFVPATIRQLPFPFAPVVIRPTHVATDMSVMAMPLALKEHLRCIRIFSAPDEQDPYMEYAAGNLVAYETSSIPISSLDRDKVRVNLIVKTENGIFRVEDMPITNECNLWQE